MYAVLPSSFFFLLLLPSFFADILAVLFARCRQMSTWTSRVQWAMPDLNRELQRTGQCRTSTRELQSGLGNAGPQPGSSGADWATPDLTRGPSERSGQCRTSAARRYVRRYVRRNVRRYVRIYVKRYVKRYVRNMPDKNVRRYGRRNVRRYVNRNVR